MATSVRDQTWEQTQPAAGQRNWHRVFAAVEGYLYLAPMLIILIVFVFIPVFTSFRLSTHRVAPFGNQEIFVGAGNYLRLIQDADYWNSIKVTLLFTLGTVPTGLLLAVLFRLSSAAP